MTYRWYDLVAAILLVALLWRGWWWMKREIRWEARRERLLRERAWRTETFKDWDEINLGPGERLIDGQVMYSSDWLNDTPRLRIVK